MTNSLLNCEEALATGKSILLGKSTINVGFFSAAVDHFNHCRKCSTDRSMADLRSEIKTGHPQAIQKQLDTFVEAVFDQTATEVVNG